MKKIAILACTFALGCGVDESPSVAKVEKPSLFGPIELTLGEDTSELVNSAVMDLAISIPRDGLHALPLVSVFEETGGFECTIVNLSNEVAFDEETGLVDNYIIGVEWFPGSDSSGCIIEVVDAASGELASIELFMDY